MQLEPQPEPEAPLPRLQWARCGSMAAISGSTVTGRSNDMDHFHAALCGEAMRSGKHYAEFTCSNSVADNPAAQDWLACVGVATADLQPGLIGAASCYYQKYLWAVCGYDGNLLHGGGWTEWKGKRRIQPGERIGLLLDCDERTLTVYANGDVLGQAVRPGLANVYGDAVAALSGQDLYWAAIPIGNRKVQIERKNDWELTQDNMAVPAAGQQLDFVGKELEDSWSSHAYATPAKSTLSAGQNRLFTS